jgi:hypothetical protein
MTSAKATREMLAVLTAAIVDLSQATKASAAEMARRTDLLAKEVKT